MIVALSPRLSLVVLLHPDTKSFVGHISLQFGLKTLVDELGAVVSFKAERTNALARSVDVTNKAFIQTLSAKAFTRFP